MTLTRYNVLKCGSVLQLTPHRLNRNKGKKDRKTDECQIQERINGRKKATKIKSGEIQTGEALRPGHLLPACYPPTAVAAQGELKERVFSKVAPGFSKEVEN